MSLKKPGLVILLSIYLFLWAFIPLITFLSWLLPNWVHAGSSTSSSTNPLFNDPWFNLIFVLSAVIVLLIFLMFVAAFIIAPGVPFVMTAIGLLKGEARARNVSIFLFIFQFTVSLFLLNLDIMVTRLICISVVLYFGAIALMEALKVASYQVIDNLNKLVYIFVMIFSVGFGYRIINLYMVNNQSVKIDILIGVFILLFSHLGLYTMLFNKSIKTFFKV